VSCLFDVCRYNPNTDRLELSYSRFKKSDLRVVGRMVLAVYHALRLVDVREGIGEDGEFTECSNMTIINLTLRIVGPTHERRLTICLLTFQVILCSIATLALISVIFASLKIKMSGNYQRVQWYNYMLMDSHYEWFELCMDLGPANRKFSFQSNHESNRLLRFESNLESNQGVVLYEFSADCHRSCVENEVIIIITDEQRCADSSGSSDNIA